MYVRETENMHKRERDLAFHPPHPRASRNNTRTAKALAPREPLAVPNTLSRQLGLNQQKHTRLPVRSTPRQGAPCILPTTAPVSYLDLRDLTALLEDVGHADLVSLETWSRDAGAYYCNEMFYRTLHAIRELGAPSEDGSSLIPASSKFVCVCVFFYLHRPR